MNFPELKEKLKTKNKKYISRAISLIENDEKKSIDLLKQIHKSCGNAYRIGITGPPGAGKSTITNELTKLLISEGKYVGIIAVDPTSPFSGGAILGDRIRMNEIGTSKNVYIRSMATRGNLGGLSKKAIDAADIIDASGFDYIIFETVGVGQSELDIAKTADTTMVVLVPESGDSVQAMKAGLMEIADFFVLNKGDRPGADSAILSIQTILNLKEHTAETYLPKIMKTIANSGEGISNIWNEVKNHREFLKNSKTFLERRNRNNRIRVQQIIQNAINDDIWNRERALLLNSQLAQITTNKISPYESAEKIIEHYKTGMQ